MGSLTRDQMWTEERMKAEIKIIWVSWLIRRKNCRVLTLFKKRFPTYNNNCNHFFNCNWLCKMLYIVQ